MDTASYIAGDTYIDNPNFMYEFYRVSSQENARIDPEVLRKAIDLNLQIDLSARIDTDNEFYTLFSADLVKEHFQWNSAGYGGFRVNKTSKDYYTVYPKKE